MSEHTVPLRKASGGSTVTDPDTGVSYTWEHGGDVIDVAYPFAVTLLGIPGGDYSDARAGAPADEPEGHEVTEPAPKAEHEVTEPAPPKPPANASRSTKK